MKKKLIVFSIILLLCGCGKAGIPFNSAENPNALSFATNTKSGSPATFTEYKLNYIDDEGFAFDVTCRISPWILQSNTEVLNATWNDIVKGQELPTINTWGFQKSGDSYSYSEYYITSFDAKIDDMYYAVGTIEIKNATDGFDFTSDRPGYPKIQIIKDAFTDYEGELITRAYFGTGEITSALGVIINAKMTSDEWGPIPFVIAHSEHLTPNNPQGVNHEKVEMLPFYLCHAETSNSDSVQIKIKHYSDVH